MEADDFPYSVLKQNLNGKKYSFQFLQEQIRVVFLEHKSRTETNSAVSASPGVDSMLPEFTDNPVPSSSGVTVHRAEGSTTPDTIEVSWILVLERGQPNHQFISSLQSLREKVFRLYSLQNCVQQDQLKQFAWKYYLRLRKRNTIIYPFITFPGSPTHVLNILYACLGRRLGL